MRSLGLHHVSKEWENTIFPDEKRLIQAYADGVNAYVKQLMLLPIEFLLSGAKFDPWTVVDTLMMGKFCSFQLSLSWQLKAFKSRIAELYSTELMEQVMPTNPEYQFVKDMSTIIEEEDLKVQGMYNPRGPDRTIGSRNLQYGTEEMAKYLSKNFTSDTKIIPGVGEVLSGMSNSWALHGNYTKSGKPMLANDPHLAHKIPGVWYIMTLKYPNGITATGVSVSGVPGIIIGRNDYVAWGFTASVIENIEMYWLDIDEQKQTYYYNNSWKPLQIRKEILKVKGSPDFPVDIYSTHHGPVILKTPVATATVFLYILFAYFG